MENRNRKQNKTKIKLNCLNATTDKSKRTVEIMVGARTDQSLRNLRNSKRKQVSVQYLFKDRKRISITYILQEKVPEIEWGDEEWFGERDRPVRRDPDEYRGCRFAWWTLRSIKVLEEFDRKIGCDWGMENMVDWASEQVKSTVPHR